MTPEGAAQRTTRRPPSLNLESRPGFVSHTGQNVQPAFLMLTMKTKLSVPFSAVRGIRSVRALAIVAFLFTQIFWIHMASAQTSPRERTSFNNDWRFIKGDPEGASSLSYTNVR